jgi:DNA-binding transcriptional regulator WhiA
MTITLPHTPELAEFMGIMLGDGCCHAKSYQITICCGTIDGTYITEYIPNLINKLFSKKVKFRKITKEGFDCLFSSIDVYKFLKKSMGFASPKITCKIPKIFFNDINLLRACVRGLFDTDGGLHRHHVKSAQLKFTNKSLPIIDSLEKALKQLNYNPIRTIDHKEKNTHAIYLFSKDVKKYFNEIGSSNPKNKIKFRHWVETGIVPLNMEIEKEVRLSDEIQENLIKKKLNEVKIVGYGAK